MDNVLILILKKDRCLDFENDGPKVRISVSLSLVAHKGPVDNTMHDIYIYIYEVRFLPRTMKK